MIGGLSRPRVARDHIVLAICGSANISEIMRTIDICCSNFDFSRRFEGSISEEAGRSIALNSYGRLVRAKGIGFQNLNWVFW